MGTFVHLERYDPLLDICVDVVIPIDDLGVPDYPSTQYMTATGAYAGAPSNLTCYVECQAGGGGSFTCTDLEGCSILSLGDVENAAPVEGRHARWVGGVLTWSDFDADVDTRHAVLNFTTHADVESPAGADGTYGRWTAGTFGWADFDADAVAAVGASLDLVDLNDTQTPAGANGEYGRWDGGGQFSWRDFNADVDARIVAAGMPSGEYTLNSFNPHSTLDLGDDVDQFCKWDSVDLLHGMPVGAATRDIVIPETGFYTIYVNIKMQTNAGGSFRRIRIYRNGARIGGNISPPHGTINGEVSCSAVVHLSSGDDINFDARQDTGGTQTCVGRMGIAMTTRE